MLRRLAALIPPPFAHLIRYHGLFAPRARDRDLLPAAPVTDIRLEALARAGLLVEPTDSAADSAADNLASESAAPGAAPTSSAETSGGPASTPGGPLVEPSRPGAPISPASINTPAAASAAATSPSSDLETLVPTGRKRLPWRELLRRVFSVDALVCPRCLGPMTVIATITEAAVLTKILTNLGLPTEPPALSPARGPAQLELFDEGWGSAPRRGQRQPNTWRSRAPPGSTGAELVVETDELPEPEYDWGA